MGISFSRPLWLLLLPGLAFLIWYWRRPWLIQERAGGREAYRREGWHLATRLLVALLLTAALAGPRWTGTVDRQAVVFALDASASMGPAVSAGEAWVRQALAARPSRDLAGVVAFGEKALVEVPVTASPTFRRLETVPGSAGSNIAAALHLAASLLPAEARPRVVLLSDGRDTGSEAVTAARRLAREGIRLDIVPLGRVGEDDLRLEGLELPARAYPGETCTLQVTVTAGRPTTATIVIERDAELVATREVELQAGTNRLAFPLDAGLAGLHRYRVRLVAAGSDSITANNEAGAIQEVQGPPRVLLVAPDEREAAPLQEALRATGQVELKVTTPAGVPADPAGWASYSAVFLVNVPAHALGRKTMEQLEAYVRDGGGGLVMTGGPDSFGPGGYAGTPVEKVLPVRMDIAGRGEQPSLGLVLVIDRSGSMDGYAGGAKKIDLAKEAAARAAAILTERDQVGVIAFDSFPWWAVPLGPAGDREALQQQIGGIYAGGGTEIYPALAAAFEALRTAPTRIKHIILLTDGMSARGGPYTELTRALAAAGITLTTVAVGDDADAGMLQALAELGRGRFYATADAATIPAIFTRETVLATRSYAVNEHFYPRAAAPGPLLTGIQTVPPLDGYIAVTPKPLAEVALFAPRGDPVLAAWQYGLGRTVAWTPDVAGRWSGSWLADPVFPRLAGNILSWLLPPDGQGAVQVTALFQEDSDGRQVIIDVDDPGGWQQVLAYRARVMAPGGKIVDVDLQPAGPGRYTGRLAARETGAYVVNIFRGNSSSGTGGPSGEGQDGSSTGMGGETGRQDGSQESRTGVEVGPARNNGEHAGAPVREIEEDGAGAGGEAAGTNGLASLVARAGVVVPYPSEYRSAGVDLAALQALAAAGGGAVLDRPEEAFASNLAPVRAGRTMEWLLLLLAGMLWLLDIARRRLAWSREERTEVLRAWRAVLAGSRRYLPFSPYTSGVKTASGNNMSYLKVKTWGRSGRERRQDMAAEGGRVTAGREDGGAGAPVTGPATVTGPGAGPGGGREMATAPAGREQGQPGAIGFAGSSRTDAGPGGRDGPAVPSGTVPGGSGTVARDPGRTAARLLAAKRRHRG